MRPRPERGGGGGGGAPARPAGSLSTADHAQRPLLSLPPGTEADGEAPGPGVGCAVTGRTGVFPTQVGARGLEPDPLNRPLGSPPPSAEVAFRTGREIFIALSLAQSGRGGGHLQSGGPKRVALVHRSPAAPPPQEARHQLESLTAASGREGSRGSTPRARQVWVTFIWSWSMGLGPGRGDSVPTPLLPSHGSSPGQVPALGHGVPKCPV